MSVLSALRTSVLHGPAAGDRYTLAFQNSQERLPGFVILDKNPMKVPILALADLKVTETVKEGKTIFNAK